MKYFLIVVAIVLSISETFAIKPEKTYLYTPEKFGIEHECIKIQTKDNVSLNVWHLPAEKPGIPIVISQSDAGNMSYWIYLGMYLQMYGFDVWMYDYRGFGESDDFAMDRNQLFYYEFVTDLSAITEYVYGKTSVPPVLIGFSMGTIIINEYIKSATVPLTHIIYDGYVASPEEWIKRLAAAGKSVTLPVGYLPSKYEDNHQKLYIVASLDKYSSIEDIPDRHSESTSVKTFDCEHISSFSHYPDEYISEIIKFVNQ